MKRIPRHIVLAAGGTGGHVIPAQALAQELKSRGHELSLITDSRGLRFTDGFGDIERYVIASGRVSEGGLAQRIMGLARIIAGTFSSWRILRRTRPDAVVGFGGHPSLPVMAAAALAGVTSCLHEQNAVLGRVNRLAARWADALALSFRNTRGARRVKRVRAVVTGNPVRAEIAKLHGRAYPKPKADGVIRILVLGGSQGARILSEVVPAALSVLPRSMRLRLNLVQQCREEDLERVTEKYHEIEVEAELTTYIEDVPKRLAKAHFVISRAGASTVSEIAASGRPSVLVPLPGATDDHQTFNARELERIGGAWLMRQSDFTAGELAKRVRGLITKPEALEVASRHARAVAKPGAAGALADLVEWLVRVRCSPRDRQRREASVTPGEGIEITKLKTEAL